MIFDEDSDAKTKRPQLRALDKMSVPELHEYVSQLKEEIGRVENELGKKEKHLNAADALFKKSGE